MKALQLFEERKLLAVVYGGRFQPFHRGHYAVYTELCKQFGEGSVWIATSNKTNFNPGEGDVSPFTFDEKVELMVQLFGIPTEKIIKCKNPAFTPKEVLEQYKAPTVCVMICGDKDVDRYSKSKYFQAYPVDEHGNPFKFSRVASKLKTVTGDEPLSYYLVSDARGGNQSGTTIRAAFQAAGDDKAKQLKAYKRFYGEEVMDDMLDLLVSKIGMIKPEPEKSVKKKVDEPVEKKPEPKEEPKPKEPPKEKVDDLALAENHVSAPNPNTDKKAMLRLQQQLLDHGFDELPVNVRVDRYGVYLQPVDMKTSNWWLSTRGEPLDVYVTMEYVDLQGRSFVLRLQTLKDRLNRTQIGATTSSRFELKDQIAELVDLVKRILK